MHKVCKGHCGETKDVTEFYRKPRYHLKYPNSDAGYTHTCQTCTKAVRKAYWLVNKEKSKDATQNARLKRAYGIDLGYVSDNTQILSNLIDYLNSNSSIQTQEKVG